MKGSIGNFFAIRKQYRINLKKKTKKIIKKMVIPLTFIYSLVGYNKNNSKNKLKKEEIRKQSKKEIKIQNIKKEKNIMQNKNEIKKQNINKKDNIIKDKQINLNKKPINNMSVKNIVVNQKKVFNKNVKLNKIVPLETKLILKKENKPINLKKVELKNDIKKDYKDIIIDLEIIETEINKLELEIFNCVSYNETYLLERKTKELLNKLFLIKNEYELNINFNSENIVLKENEINEYIDRLNNDYKKIYETKKKLLTSCKKEVKNDKQPKKVEKSKKVKTNFELVNEEILNQIKYYKYLMSFKKSKFESLNSIMFVGLNFYSNSFLNIKGDLKYFASLITLINCFKVMRKLLNNNDELCITYNYQDEIYLYNEILFEIFLLKIELNKNYNEEQIINIIDELNILENEFMTKIKKINFQKTLKSAV